MFPVVLQVLCEQQDSCQIGVAVPLKPIPRALRQAMDAMVQWLQLIPRVQFFVRESSASVAFIVPAVNPSQGVALYPLQGELC